LVFLPSGIFEPPLPKEVSLLFPDLGKTISNRRRR